MVSVDITPLLKITNTDKLTEFLHRCIDDLIGTNVIDFDTYSNDIELLRTDFQKARNLVHNIYKEQIKSDGDFKLAGVSNDIHDALKNCYDIRKEELYQALVRHSLLKNEVNLVENFDWKVKWVMGSSKMASLREPLLQMNLHCAGDKCIEFEANLEKLSSFITELEKVRDELKN